MSNPFTQVVRRLHADARPVPVHIPEDAPAAPVGWSAPRTGGVHWQRPAAERDGASRTVTVPVRRQ